jgi:hypothetical protein
MDRRGFLRMLGLGAAAVVAPAKTYAFFGNILRPKPTFEHIGYAHWEPIVAPAFSPVISGIRVWIDGEEISSDRIDLKDGIVCVTTVTMDPNCKMTVSYVQHDSAD